MFALPPFSPFVTGFLLGLITMGLLSLASFHLAISRAPKVPGSHE